MKQIFKISLLLFIILFTTPITSSACDICGCANSGSYFGLMPQSHRSLIGVRYNHLNFNTHPENPILATQERFNIAEIYARFFPVNRVQVMAFLPYRFDYQETSAITKSNKGLSDMTILANYNVLNTMMDGNSSSPFTHTLLVGGGLKLPTGKFKYNENDPLQVANPNFQLGTGSIDFIVNAFYTLNYGKWGLSTNVSRKFNTTNSEEYRFGNQVYGTVDLFRTFEIGNATLTPTVGIYAEHVGHGQQNGVIQDITGGKMLNGSAGLHLFTNKWTAGINAQKPISQKSSSGHVFLNSRFQVQLGWLF